MIDLHLHLDGSLSEQDFLYLAKKDGVDLGSDFPNNIYVPFDCPSLEVYLERFALPGKLLQSKENLKHVTGSLVRRLYKMGYIYAEIRFAPQLHTEKGLTQMDAALAALNGLEDALKECPGFEANLILCCMRHAPQDINIETIEVANKLKGTRVVAVDLAGAEALHPCIYYKEVFDLAKKYNLNITIHGGEATGSDEVMMALDNGAKRIGHGVHLDVQGKDGDRASEEHICFEFCPTSNLQTKSLKSYKEVPLLSFMKKGIPVTINSDNMTVSNTDVYQEFSHLYQTFDLSKRDVYMMLKNSIKYAFTSNEVKERLLEKLDERIDKFYSQISI